MPGSTPALKRIRKRSSTFCSPLPCATPFWSPFKTKKLGKVHLVDLGIAGKARPMTVFSIEDSDPPRALAICAPVTISSSDGKYEIAIGNTNFLKSESLVNVQELQAIS